MNASAATINLNESPLQMIVTEIDLAYDKLQNVLLSCQIDGCNRISYCSCDCNDSHC